ncbi:hypothetical protein [Kribbella shirazensis]|uniref:Alkylmercury lyase n=1 Tax=Kribbella shirazensis TaxID=1105143 RepID=A0A7X5V4U7_9ACTN|nr:hypothetical protein [Kribbella shirazensis]NIK54655.1 hypothetical protein [Kribbella shirazensis]
MRLEVLHVPECPNVAPMLDRLALVTDVPVTTRMIDTDADAVRFGMVGSPTLLVDGVDPFVSVDDDEECACTTLSCRLYRDEAGRIVPAPSVGQLRKANRRSRPAATRHTIRRTECLAGAGPATGFRPAGGASGHPSLSRCDRPTARPGRSEGRSVDRRWLERRGDL